MEATLLDLRLYLVESLQLQLRNFHDSLLVHGETGFILLSFHEEFIGLAKPLQVEERDTDAYQGHVFLIVDG